MIFFLLCVFIGTWSSSVATCRFASKYSCKDFDNVLQQRSYMFEVMKWEGKFAQPGIGYDASSGYTYDGHPIDYNTGELYGDPHLFSAPSKESIHVAILALAVQGDEYALEFVGGLEKAISMLELKFQGYNDFNERFPGYGCWNPWVGFDTTTGAFSPLESWSTPYYKVPGLDNGEWFWALYAVTIALEDLGSAYANLAAKYRSLVTCQQNSAKSIFYRGDGDVSATVYILNATASYSDPSNYMHCDGYLNDPYEGETMTMLLYLFSDWTDDETGREMLWIKKRGLLQAVNYTVPDSYYKHHPNTEKESNGVITVQRGWWFSTHEQWKVLLLPYISPDLPVVTKLYKNAEKVRTVDMALNDIPGMMASINDVTNGSQNIPDYSSACGVQSVAFEDIERRDLITPYGTFGLFQYSTKYGLCWYNNMLSAPRMQSAYGSIEAINVNGTEISPLTTWDSKITTVLSMLGGVGSITKRGLQSQTDSVYGSAYHRFVYILNREYGLAFGEVSDVLGDEYEFMTPLNTVPSDMLEDWDLDC